MGNDENQQDLDSLYVSEELTEREVRGVKFLFRELSGEDILSIVNGCTDVKGNGTAETRCRGLVRGVSF